MYYFRELYLEEAERQNYMPIIHESMKVVKKESELNVAAIRVQYRDCQNLKLEGGHQ